MGLGLQLMFYATPIVYSAANIHESIGGKSVSWWLDWNPMTHYVGAMRSLVYDLAVPSAATVGAIVACSVVSLCGGWAIFHRQAPGLIEEL